MLSPLQRSKELEGILTELTIQQYVDSVLVIVTQVGKVGNLIQASLPATTPLPSAPSAALDQSNIQSLPQPPIAIQLIPVLGRAPSDRIQTLHNLYASQIATLVWTAESEYMQVTRKNVIIGIALRKTDSSEDSDLSEPERNTFIGVMQMLQEMLTRT